LEKEGNWRRLHFERKGAIAVDGDDHRDRRTLFKFLGLGVEGFAKLHDVEAALTERRPDWRRRVCGTRRHLQLQIAGDFLRHEQLPAAPPSLLSSARGGEKGGGTGFVVRLERTVGSRPSPPTHSEIRISPNLPLPR